MKTGFPRLDWVRGKINPKKFSPGQWISLISLVAVLLTLPLSLLVTFSQTDFFQKAFYPVTPPIVTPTPRVIPTVTPVPTIVVQNHSPVITTTSLSPANRYSNYWARINSYDPDLSDTPTSSISGLPAGLKQTNCTSYLKKDTITGITLKWFGCDISGKTTMAPQNYNIKVVVTDGHGGRAEKNFMLKVNP